MSSWPGVTLCCFLLGVVCPLPAFSFESSDNTLTETYGPTYKMVNTPKDRTNHGADVGVFKTEFDHFDTWKYGSNRFVFGIAKSNGEDPVKHGSDGATQFYGGFLSSFSLNRITSSQDFSFGPIKDSRLDIGFDWNEKNSNLQNRKKELVLGPSFAFDVPGSLIVGLHVVKEWNHNGIRTGDFAYQPAFELTLNSKQPLTFTGLPLKLQNIIVIETPKGKDGFGRSTTTQFLSINYLILDIGDIIFSVPKKLDIYTGFQYWLNKTGDDHSIKAGAVEETAVFGIAYHF